MKFAYADPPYIGQAKKHYASNEVDHEALLFDLSELYNGWALSCSSSSLRTILRLPSCPEDVRIMAWVKPFCSFKPNVNPAYAWEPIIVRVGRERGRELPTIRDWVSSGITLERGMSGVKPDEFCYWLFEVLGMLPDDDFSDIFPGSGAVTKAWKAWQLQLSLSF